MNILKEFPTEYITGVDVEAAKREGKPALLTIKAVSRGDARDPKTGRTVQRPELHFQGTPKKLRINPSSVRLLVRAWGAETDGWVGKCVELSLLACNLKDKLTGEPVLGVLARPAKPADVKQEASQPAAPVGEDLSYDGDIQ